MRTITSPQRTLIASDRVNHYLRVEVEDPDRVFRDLTNLGGVDWVESAQWGDSLDTPTGTATISLRRDTTSPVVQSIAPTMGGSSLNRNGVGAYAPLLDTGRNIRISTAVTAAGVSPVSGDWKVVFIGRIDKVDWHAPTVTLDCRDLGGWIVDAMIQAEKAYATDAPTAVETVMAQLLADYPVYGTPALYTPASPGWMINNTKKTVQARKSVLEALQQDWALSIGWVCRYRFDAADNFRLTFYDPDRTKTTPDDSFGPTEYRDITGLAVEDTDVRNLINGIYFDADGNKHTRTAQNTGSQSKYGVKFMEIQLAQGDQIDSDDEMDRLLAAAVSDLGAPFATHEMETLYYWPVQLGDLHQYNSNLDHYDSAQFLAVVGYTHRFVNGEAWTTIQARGNVIGAYHAWLRRSSAADSGTLPAELAIQRVTFAESADGLTRNYEVTCGDAVDTLHVHHRSWRDGTTGDPFDFSQNQGVSDDQQLSIIRPSVSDGLFRFSLTHPVRGFTVAARLVPRSAPPRIVDGESVPIQLSPAPPSVNAKIHPSRIGAVGSLSIDIAFGISDADSTGVLVDVIQDSLTLSTTILSRRVTSPGTIDSGTDAALGNIALPGGADFYQYRVRITDVSGQAWWFGPANLSRDPLADAKASLLNFRPNATAVVAFGPDTDSIRVTSHDGKATTWNAAALALAGSPVQYITGTTVRDDSSTEAALIVDEVRSGFKVEAQGGGTWTTILGPLDLRGTPSNPPTAKMRVVKAADASAEDLYITPSSPVGEQVSVYYRDGDQSTSPTFQLCVSAVDRTPRYVASGTEIGPADYFANIDGTGSPSTKLSGISLTREQVARKTIGVQGKESGVQNWLPYTLSLLEQPWLESISVEWDNASGLLRARVKGGAHCASVYFEASSASNFSAPTTASAALTDGADLTQTFALSGAQRGKTWYVRATPFNLASLAGLPGVAQVGECAVPAVYTVTPSATENTTAGTGTLSLDVQDPGSVLDNTNKIKAYVTNNGVRTLVTPTSSPAGAATTGTYTFQITTDPKHNVKVEPIVYFADGSSTILGAWTFDRDKFANVISAPYAINNQTATVNCTFDTDTVVGAATGRYSTNGGSSWTTFAVSSSLTGSFNITLTSATQTVTIEGQDSDGNWGSPITIQLPPYQAAQPQGTVSVNSNGSWSFTVDGPANTLSFKYAVSTSAFPSDATAAAGTVIGSGARTATLDNVTAGQAALTFGQTIYITVIPYTAAAGGGTALPSIRLMGSYQTFTATKTVGYSRAGWAEQTTGGANYGSQYNVNGEPMNGSIPANGIQKLQQTLWLPVGVKLIQTIVNYTWVSAANPLNAVVAFVFYNSTFSTASSGSTPPGGAATLTMGSINTTVLTSTTVRVQVNFVAYSGTAADAGQANASDVFIQYQQLDPSTNY